MAAIKKELSGESSNQIIPSNKSEVKIVTPMVDLVHQLIDVRDTLASLEADFKDKIEPIKALKDRLQSEIIQILKDRKEFSARFENATATLAVRKTVKVVDEQATVIDLMKRNLKDYVQQVTQLNALFHESLAKEIAKNGKTDIAGLEIHETEYLSIRKANEDSERRKVTTNDYKLHD